MKAGFFTPISTSSLLILVISILCIAYKLFLNTTANNTPPTSNISPFNNGNILNAQNLSLSKQLTSQIISTITQNIAEEKSENNDMSDIDIWSLLFHSICCQSSLFRRKIWEKELIYVPLSYALPQTHLKLFYDSLPNLHHINKTYKLFEYEYLYESANNFFVSNVIKSTEFNNVQRIGPRHMKSMLRHSTLVINKAGIIFNDLHNLERSVMDTFGYPSNTNAYFSGQRNCDNSDTISSRIHTDRQDTFIIQIYGHKRWKIWKPKVKLAYFRQQRGKGDDDIFEPPKDLGVQWNDTLIDVILNPWDLLYVPRAFPHSVEVHRNENKNLSDFSVHLTVGIETETVGLTMDNLLQCILGINNRNTVFIKQLSEVIMDIVNHQKYHHFRRSIPFGFNYKNENGNAQIYNRVQNLTTELYELKRKFGGNKKMKKKRIKPSKPLINKAYEIFEKGKDELLRIYKNKLDIVSGKNWNEKQEDLQKILIRKVKKYFRKCAIDVENTNMLFSVDIMNDAQKL